MKQLLAVLIAAGFAMAQTPAPKAATAKATTKSTAKAKAAAPNLLNPSTLKARAPEMFQVRFNTTKGEVVLDITRSWAPIGADRFYNLVRAGFFTNMTFFRVVPRFIVQFGISPRPDIAKVWENARIVDDPVTHSNKRGTITFATAGPNTRTTQLFINYSDNAALDGQGFAAFGEVVQGMDIVDKIFAGYGEQPDQGRLQSEGKAYTDKNFPMLDKILTATIVPATPAGAAAAPATKSAPAAKK